MPTAAPRPCSAPGCPRLVTAAQPCPEHPRRSWAAQSRASASRRGYDRQWRNFRAVVSAQAPPACAVCGVTFPLELDHITPVRLGGGSNEHEAVQWLCRRHHHQKTARQRRLERRR